MEQQAFDAEAIKSESNEISWTKINDKQLICHLIEEIDEKSSQRIWRLLRIKNRVTMLVHTPKRCHFEVYTDKLTSIDLFF